LRSAFPRSSDTVSQRVLQPFIQQLADQRSRDLLGIFPVTGYHVTATPWPNNQRGMASWNTATSATL
jgi:hypothetical protein